MFEAILEKILLNYFGKFIQGFDKSNLHLQVWSGDVAIENVSLRPDIVDLIDFPINLLHSKIGKLKIQAQWSKLSTQPVEITLEDILILVGPKSKNEWDFNDLSTVTKKFEVIESYANQLQQKFMALKDPKNNANQSYLSKMSAKVIDNIQLNIKNIHLRWEDQGFSFGMTLDELTATTMDKNWKKAFIDRTIEENIKEPMNKLIKLNSFSLYWNKDENQMLKDNLEQSGYFEYQMKRQIFSKNYVPLTQQDKQFHEKLQALQILNISSEARLIQNHKDNVKDPLNKLQLELENIDVTVYHGQLQQAIVMLEQIILYNKMLFMYRKKGVTIDEKTEETYQQQFILLYGKIYSSENKGMSVLNEQEKTLFETIIKSMNYEKLFKWVKEVVKLELKQTQIKSVEKKKTKRSWFGQSVQKYELTGNELEEIEQYIETSFENNNQIQQMSQSIIRPQTSVKLNLTMNLEKASLCFYRNMGEGMEGIQLILDQIFIVSTTFQNGEFDLAVNLTDLIVQMQTIVDNSMQKNVNMMNVSKAIVNPQNEVKIEKVLHRLDSVQSKKILNLQYKQYEIKQISQEKEDDKTQQKEDASIDLCIEPIQFIYSAKFIKTAQGIFDLKYEGEDIKENAFNKIEELQDKTEENLKNTLGQCYKVATHIHIGHQLVIIPTQNGKLYLDLGQFQLNSHDINNYQSLYDEYKFQIQSVNFQYQENLTNMKYTILKDYQINSSLQKLKTVQNQYLLLEKYDYYIIDAHLSDIKLQINEKIAAELVDLPKILFPQDESLQELQEEKNILIEKSYTYGFVKKLGVNIQQWKEYFIIYNGAYIYLFTGQKQLKAQQKIYIKGSQITIKNGDQIFLQNRYQSCTLKFASPQQCQHWLKHFQEQLDSKEHLEENEEQILNEQQQQQKQQTMQYNKKSKINVELNQFKLELNKNNNENMFYIEIQNLIALNTKVENDPQQEFLIKLQSIIIMDYTHDFTCQAYQPLITSHMPQDKDNSQFLEIKALVGEKIDLDLEFHKLYLNWKPDTIIKLKEITKLFKKEQELQEGDLELQKNNRQQTISNIISYLNLKNFPTEEQKQLTVKDKFKQLIEETYSRHERNLFTINMKLKQAQINLIHWQTHTGLAKIKLNDTKLNLISKQNSLYCFGGINDIQLLDVTQYPKTQDSDRNFPVPETQFLGKKEKSNKGEVLKFKYSFYDKDVLKNAQNVYDFCELEIFNIFLMYQQQVIMRLIDYFLNQIMMLITQSELMTINQNYLQNKSQEGPKQVFGELEDIVKRLVLPSFMDLRINLYDSQLYLKPFPQDTEYFILQIDNINVFNQQRQSKERFQDLQNNFIHENPVEDYQQIWLQKWIVNVNYAQLTFYDNQKYHNISQPFKINIGIEMPMYYYDLIHVWPIFKQIVDRGIKIKGASTPLVMHFKRIEYLQLIKMIMHNFTYDDYKDELFYHDYKIQKQLKPNSIDMILDVEQLKLLLMTDEYKTPKAGINLGNLRIQWAKSESLNQQTFLYGETLEISEFKKIKVENMLVETTYVGKLQQTRHYEIKTFLEEDQEQKNQLLNFSKFQFENFSKDNSQLKFDGRIQKTGEKDFILTFKEVKMLAETSFYMNTGFWLMLEDWVYYQVDDPYFKKPQITFQFDTINTIIILPNDVKDTILTTRGDITFLYRRKEMIQIRQKAETGQIDSVQDAYFYSLTLMNLELLRCSQQQILEKQNFKQVEKISVILPFTCHWMMKDELQLDTSTAKTINYLRKNNISIEKTIVKLGYKDIGNAKNALEYQQKQMEKVQWRGQQQKDDSDISSELDNSQQIQSIENEERQLEVPDENYKIPTYNNNQQLETQVQHVMTQMVLECEIHGYSLEITNDAGKQCSPVLQITINSSQVQYTRNQVKSIIQACISLQGQYYNVQLSTWEPFLERTAIDLDYFFQEKNSNPQKFMQIDLNKSQHALNINLSNELIRLIAQTQKLWMDEIDKEKQEIKDKLQNVNQIKINNQGQNQLQYQSASDISSISYNEKQKQNLNTQTVVYTKEKESQNIEQNQIVNNNLTKKAVRQSQMVIQNMDLGLQQQDLTEYISPYSISNECGYDIEIDDMQGRKLILKNEGIMNYRLQHELEKNLFNEEDYQRKDKNQIQITVIHPEKVLSPPMGLCNLDSNKTKEHTFNNKQGHVGKVILESLTDHSKKIMKIRSNLSFQNQTSFVIQILIFQNQKMSEQLEVNPNGKLYLPFDLTKSHISIRFSTNKQKDQKDDKNISQLQQGENQFSDLIDLANILKSKHNAWAQIKHSKNNYSILKIDKSKNLEDSVIIEPVFRLKNCTPFQFNYQLYAENQKTLDFQGFLAKNQEYSCDNFSLADHLIALKIKLPGFQKSDTCIIHNPTNRNEKPQIIGLVDYFGNKSYIRIQVIEKDNGGSKILYIYPEAYLVNETQQEFFYYGSKEISMKPSIRDFNLVPGQRNQVNQHIQSIYEQEFSQEQRKITLLSNQQQMILSFVENPKYGAKPLSFGGVLGYDILILSNPNQEEDSLYEYVAQVQTHCVDVENNIYCKIIIITPKIIIVNDTFCDLQVIQQDYKSSMTVVHPHQRLPFFWADRNKPYKINVSLFDQQTMYGWSGPIDFEKNIFSFTLRDKRDLTKVKFMKGEMIEQQHQIYVRISECRKENAIYLVENQLINATIYLYQSCFMSYNEDYQKSIGHYKFQIPENQSSQFGWEFPGSDVSKNNKEVIVEIDFKNKQFQVHRFIINLDDVSFKREIKVKNIHDPKKVYSFYITISLEKNTRILRFLDTKKMKIKGEEEDLIKTQLGLFISNIGISFISTHKNLKQRKEIAYISINQLELMNIETIQKRTTQIRCQYIGIDNNISYSTPFPKTLTNYQTKSTQQKNLPVISFVLEQNISAQQMQIIDSAELSIQPIIVKITDSQIEYFKDFFSEFQSFQPQEDIKNQQIQVKQSMIWEKMELTQNQKLIYVKKIKIYSFPVTLSFKSAGKNNDNFILNFTNAIGVSAKNIDGAQIKLNGIQIEKCLDTQQGIQQKIISRYKENIVNKLFSILGSANLIGNPVGLINNIGQGMKDLIEMPADGFVKGPIEGGIGIAKGTTSLVKNTIQGTFNSVHTITDSVGTGLSSLTMDRKYIEERERQNNRKADNVVEGVGLGLLGLATGVGKGVTGIFTKPVEGAQKKGVEGFFKGVGKGLMGAVIKPVTGVMDLASKTSEGIKNTTTMFDEQQKENDTRSRLPRTFYGKTRRIKQYNLQDAEVMAFFQDFKNHKYGDINFIDSFNIGNNQLLVLSIEWIILINLQTKNRIWDFPTNYFFTCLNHENPQNRQNPYGIEVRLKQATEQITQGALFISIKDGKQRKTVLNRLNYLADIEQYEC